MLLLDVSLHLSDGWAGFLLGLAVGWASLIALALAWGSKD